MIKYLILIICFYQLNLCLANKVYVIRRSLNGVPLPKYDKLAHSALLLEISGQYTIVEYMDTNNGSVIATGVDIS